ncbi:MAG TPA: lasso RiPP family leader peptide-containing protein [Thermoanaerobaculia bacterium]|nr:lasso RiPP family leader peptide-containing protein [Thermoanaerobaculia bacterium]
MSAIKHTPSPSPNGSERKPYRAPRLTVYGSVRDLTLEGGPHRTKDGGNNAINNRT